VFVTVGTGGIGLHKSEGKEPYIVTQYSGFGLWDVAVLKGSTIDARFKTAVIIVKVLTHSIIIYHISRYRALTTPT
jgi:hypothetical protein